MPVSEQLSALAVAKMTKPGRHHDAGGLYLQIKASGSKSWVVRYMRFGKARHHGLGPYPLVSLAEARERARAARRQLLDGVDPVTAKAAERAEAKAKEAAKLTFTEAARRYIAAHSAGWKSAVHREQWPATIKAYCEPIFGDVDVAKIETSHVLKALEPIWTTKPETASRVRGRIESVLGWAAARGHRSGENPARWRGHLDRLLPARSKVRRVKHHKAIGIDDLPGLMAELRANDAISSKALQFATLTAGRTGEVIGARWAEIDMANKLWIVPAARMKTDREHRVALSAAAVKLLENLPRERGNDHVFIGGKKGTSLSNMAMLKFIKELRPGDSLTVHGMRSTFRDWAAERTSFSSEVIEMAMSHTIGNKVEAAYRRGDLLAKRYRLAEAWAGFLASGGAKSGDNVRPIRSAQHG